MGVAEIFKILINKKCKCENVIFFKLKGRNYLRTAVKIILNNYKGSKKIKDFLEQFHLMSFG